MAKTKKGKEKAEEEPAKEEVIPPFHSLVRQLVLDSIKSVTPSPDNNQWKVLILDDDSRKIVGSAVKMFDILEEGVDIVENLEIAREPLPNKEAIYIVSATKDSVQRIIDDFDPEVNEFISKKDQYAAVHLFFTSVLPDNLFEKLTKAQVRAYIGTMKELNLLFHLQESQVFHTNHENSLKEVFSPVADKDSVQKHLCEISKRLCTVVTTLGEAPLIRYDKRSNPSKRLASIVKDDLAALAAAGLELKVPKKTPADERVQVLILDRTVDLVAPILHEFTYQAMVHDLVPVDEHGCIEHSYTDNTGKEQTRKVLLSENDQLWLRLRHMHIQDTCRWVVKAFNEFVAANKKVGDLEMGNASTLKEMGEAMRALPQYRDMKSKYAVQIDLATTCMDYFKKRNLKELAMLEQDLVVGVKRKDVKKALSQFFNDDKVHKKDKLRLLLIYLISQSEQGRMTLKDKEEVVIDAGYPPDPQGDAKIIRCLGSLGVKLDKASLKENVKEAKEKEKEEKKVKKKKGEEDEASYELSRYVPVVKRLTQSLIAGDLPTAKFPFVDPPADVEAPSKESSSAGSKSKWGAKKQDGGKEETGTQLKKGRVIVFVIGGMTYSETRSAYELTEATGKEVIIGSSCIVTPKLYLNMLKDIV